MSEVEQPHCFNETLESRRMIATGRGAFGPCHILWPGGCHLGVLGGAILGCLAAAGSWGAWSCPLAFLPASPTQKSSRWGEPGDGRSPLPSAGVSPASPVTRFLLCCVASSLRTSLPFFFP